MNDNVFGIVLTIILVVTVFFGPQLISLVGMNFKRTDAKIVLLMTVVVMTASLVGLITLLPVTVFDKVVICLLSVGTVTLLTTGVLSLLFIATIPEEMEEEADEDQR